MVSIYLSREDEMVLIGKLRSSDRKIVSQAKKELVKAHQFLIAGVVSKYPNKNKTVDDLMKAGNIGLVKAMEMFKTKKHDETKNFKFSTYATWWIRAEIHKALGLSVE